MNSTERAQAGSTHGFTVAIHAAEEGGYWGEVLELPGCMSQGESEAALLSNIANAIRAVLDSYHDDGETPPVIEPILKTVQVTV